MPRRNDVLKSFLILPELFPSTSDTILIRLVACRVSPYLLVRVRPNVLSL